MRPGPGRVEDDELVRWREASHDPRALPARAADLMDAARAAPGLPPETLARIGARIAGDARRPSRLGGLPLGLRLATLMAVLLTSFATAKGAMLLWKRYVTVPAAPRAVAARQAPALKPRVEIAPVIVAIDEAARDEAVPEALPTTDAPPRPKRALERRPPAETPDPANEAQLLADALARLRQAKDPGSALALLDQYAKTYPRGVLAPEARSARLEALLARDDRRGALALLDQDTTFAGRLGAEQLLTRAELRASVGRYADALGDFDRLLGSSARQPDAHLERALYGRAVTLGHLGRADRARADLEAYQRRFPAGKHATEVARLLKGTPAERRP